MKKEICLIWKKGILLLAALGFFGLLYPEFCMLEDTCRVVYRLPDGREEEVLVEKDSELYYSLLSAEPEEIKIKSRLFEAVSAYFEKDKGK